MTSSQKNFIAIKLTQNSKNPLPHVSWSAKENQHKSDDLRGGANYGVLCGPVNRITVVDVDDYKAPKDPKLLQGMMGILGTPAYKTYTVSTPSGGKHYYFQHVPEFGTTHNAPDIIPLDIQCKGAYVVGAGSSINGKSYSIEVDAPIIKMPAELKKFFEENDLAKQRMTKKTDPNFFKSKAAPKPASSEHYSYYMKKTKFDEAVQKLGAAYWSDRNKWLQFTTACHAVGHMDIWDKHNQLHPDNYGETKITPLMT
jgi:hypothetical protein